MENTTAQNLPSTSTALYETWRGTLLQYSTVKHVTLLVLGPFMCKELITILYNLFFDPLRDIPGPFWARLSRLWELKMAFSGRMHETLVELHQTHGMFPSKLTLRPHPPLQSSLIVVGPVVRVGPNTYSFSQPEDVATIYSASASKTFPKSNFYNTSGDPARPNIFSMTSEKQHTQRKRKLAGLYNMSTMVHYEAAVDAVNSILKQKFSGLAESADAVNLPELMQFYAFDVIGQISVSPASHNTCSYSSVLTCFVHIDRTFGMIEAGRDIDDFVAITKEALLYMGTVGLFAEMHPLFVWWNKLSGGRNAGVALEKLAKKSLEKAGKQGISNEGASRSDPFVSKLIRMHEGGTVGTDDMIDSIGANIAAGSDTTAITLSAAFYHLYRNPDILAKLRAEIDGRPDPISFEESQQMPYLQAVINETLRIHPAVGYLLRRKVPQGGSCLAGRQFPQGVGQTLALFATCC
jgi:cytochrome P450